jgi:hypothetical protein
VTHPADGLQDIYEYAQVTLPYRIPVRFVYHKYYADYGNGHYGQEFDACVSKQFGKYWSAMLEFAQYLGEDKALPVVTAAHLNNESVWATVEFIF